MSNSNASDPLVIVYGTVCLDLLWRVEALPPPGGYVEILEERKAIGGEAANTAIALSRWGIRTALVGNVIGGDENGRLLRDLLIRDAPELDLSWLKFEASEQTPYCVCMATPDGERTMFGHRFADMECTPLDLDLAAAASFFTAEPNAYRSGLDAAGAAHAAGCVIVPMDYARDTTMNGISTMALTSSEHVGRSLSENDLADFAISANRASGAKIIVTRGAEGCLLAAGSGSVERFAAFNVTDVVDTTGSGDVFRAGILYGMCNGWDDAECIRFASAAAALNCRSMGGWTGVQSVEETIRFRDTAALRPIT